MSSFWRAPAPEKASAEEDKIVKVNSEGGVEAVVRTIENEKGVCEVHILGTMHVSKRSCQDVKEIIERLQPDAVVVELCRARIGMLQMTEIKEPTFQEMMVQIREKKQNTFAVVYGWWLAKIGNKLEVVPGSEFRTAFETARSLPKKVQIVLGDRDVKVTVARMWGGLTRWEKFKFIGNVLWGSIRMPSAEELAETLESMKESDVLLAAIKECEADFPSLLGPLLTERDLYLVASIRKVAVHHSSVVVVVGAGHIPGMLENWDKEIDVAALMTVPSKGVSSTWIRTGFKLMVLAGATAITAWVAPKLLPTAVRHWRGPR